MLGEEFEVHVRKAGWCSPWRTRPRSAQLHIASWRRQTRGAHIEGNRPVEKVIELDQR